MSSSGDNKKKTTPSVEDLRPNYSLIEPEVYREAEDFTTMTLFKLWRQGQIMQNIYRRRTLFYRPPNWLLIFALGPTAIVRLYMHKTLKTILRIHEDKQARRKIDR